MKKFLDGCHSYGWIINVVISASMFSYFLGNLNRSIQDLEKRIARIEYQLDRK